MSEKYLDVYVYEGSAGKTVIPEIETLGQIMTGNTFWEEYRKNTLAFGEQKIMEMMKRLDAEDEAESDES